MGYTKKQQILAVAQCFSEGLNQTEIAEELGISVFSVKRRMAYLRSSYPETYISAWTLRQQNLNKDRILKKIISGK